METLQYNNHGLDLNMAPELSNAFEDEEDDTQFFLVKHNLLNNNWARVNTDYTSSAPNPPQPTAFSSPVQQRYDSSRNVSQTSTTSTGHPAMSASQSSYSFPSGAGTPQSSTVDTISPLQTCFDSDQVPFNTDRRYSTDNEPRSAISVDSSSFYAPEIARQQASRKRNTFSFATEPESETLPNKHARRQSIPTARHVYLEKNRIAASRCRSKQKRAQDELVETARDMERKNKVLKHEVELLKGDMRDLMELVGRHGQCSDNRLRTYVQREADRLGAGGAGSPFLKTRASNQYY